MSYLFSPVSLGSLGSLIPPSCGSEWFSCLGCRLGAVGRSGNGWPLPQLRPILCLSWGPAVWEARAGCWGCLKEEVWVGVGRAPGSSQIGSHAADRYLLFSPV